MKWTFGLLAYSVLQKLRDKPGETSRIRISSRAFISVLGAHTVPPKQLEGHDEFPSKTAGRVLKQAQIPEGGKAI